MLRQAKVVRRKLQIEAEAERIRNEEELLDAWQTTIDAEEEADTLETKEGKLKNCFLVILFTCKIDLSNCFNFCF